MASSNFLFSEGNSIHRPPIFNGQGYHYWKTRMQIFIEAIDLNIWEAIEIGPYVPTIIDGSTSTCTTIQKPRDKWSGEDRRRVQYNLKAKKIITSALGIDEYLESQTVQVPRRCGTHFNSHMRAQLMLRDQGLIL